MEDVSGQVAYLGGSHITSAFRTDVSAIGSMARFFFGKCSTQLGFLPVIEGSAAGAGWR